VQPYNATFIQDGSGQWKSWAEMQGGLRLAVRAFWTGLSEIWSRLGGLRIGGELLNLRHHRAKSSLFLLHDMRKPHLRLKQA
jgi:hypothetical protein